MNLGRILAPTNLSHLGGEGFRVAASLAGTMGARLTLLHVLSGGALARMAGASAYQRHLDQIFEDVEAAVAGQFRQVVPWGARLDLAVDLSVAAGAPVREIVRAARRVHADLIVMGTDGGKGAARLLRRGLAERVARESPCPVLIVRAAAQAEAAGQPHSTALAAALLKSE